MTGIEGPMRPAGTSPEALVAQAARDAGFSLSGVSRPSPSPRSDSAFDAWIGRGMHGEMEYLPKGAAKRKNPALLLGGAKSVICVAVDYYSAEKERWNRGARRDGRGCVALYAHGRDYHDVMRGMLADLEGRLRTLFPGVKTRAAVDTEPVSERDLALQAGIGWLGKNTCVISPRYGSWLFLGEIVTDLALEAAERLETLCGACTRCVDACPTGALEEFSLDARKCVSYLTVEKRGEIPAGFHRAMGDRLFGCDECQRVCPFNEGAAESVVFGGGDRNALAGMTIDALAGISEALFAKLARGSAIRRCGFAGMRRNALIAARNRLALPPDGARS